MEYNSNTRSSRYVSDSSHARRLNEEQMRNMVRKSTNGTRTQNKPRVVKVYADRAKKAIIALCCICVVAASGITAASIDAINDFREERVISQYSSQYRQEAIGHNTHRTQNNIQQLLLHLRFRQTILCNIHPCLQCHHRLQTLHRFPSFYLHIFGCNNFYSYKYPSLKIVFLITKHYNPN